MTDPTCPGTSVPGFKAWATADTQNSPNSPLISRDGQLAAFLAEADRRLPDRATAQRKILALLAADADNGYGTQASVRGLAARLGTHPRSVQRQLAALKAAGLLRCAPHTVDRRPRNRYVLLVGEVTGA